MVLRMTNEKLVNEYRKTGSKEILTEICKKNKGLIGMIVKNLRPIYANESVKRASVIESDDLEQYGYIGLIKAVRYYDSDRGANFSTVAVWWIRNEIYRGMNDQGHTIRIPANVREGIRKLQRFKQSFLLEYGFEPQICEMSAFLGVSEQAVEGLLKAEAQDQIGSLNSPIRQDEDGEAEILDTVPDNHDYYEDLEESIFTGQAKAALWPLVDDVLTEDQAAVIRGRFRDGKTRQEIGDEMNLTRERVRQTEQVALKTLRYRRAVRELARWYDVAAGVSYRSVGVGSFTRTRSSATERAALMRIDHAQEIRKAVKSRDRMDAAGLTRQEQDVLVRAERERIAEILAGV